MAFHRTLWSLVTLTCMLLIALSQCAAVRAQVRPVVREVTEAAAPLTAVPEPATWGCMGAVALVCVVLRRRVSCLFPVSQK
jgi:hypothetical protein